jgi:hypothetical protein
LCLSDIISSNLPCNTAIVRLLPPDSDSVRISLKMDSWIKRRLSRSLFLQNLSFTLSLQYYTTSVFSPLLPLSYDMSLLCHFAACSVMRVSCVSHATPRHCIRDRPSSSHDAVSCPLPSKHPSGDMAMDPRLYASDRRRYSASATLGGYMSTNGSTAFRALSRRSWWGSWR